MIFGQIKTNSMWVAVVLLVVWSCGGVTTSQAETGTADSPVFGLNTLWASGVDGPATVPAIDRLGECYPNPFNPATKIRFELSQSTKVCLKVYDLQGRLVRTLLDSAPMTAGSHDLQWDGRDNRNIQVATGVYLYRLVTEALVATRRMTLVK